MPYLIKFESLKKKALDIMGGKFGTCMPNVITASYALAMGIDKGTIGWRKNYDELWEICKQTINRWDIRMVSKLIECFPGIVPERCLGKKPVCYMADDENATWMVEWI